MKKLILTLFTILLFSVSGWASDQQPTDASPEPATSSQETMEPSPETSTSNQTDTPVGTEPAPADPTATASETASTTTDIEAEKPTHSFGHKLLFYLPNRILDVFDIVRLRVRVGPGLAIGARVTKPISFFFGGYGSIYAGLPGPRLEPTVKLPFGIENYGGLSLSLLDSTNEGRFAPNYSPTEIGASLQLLIVGFDVDVDPVEVLDLATGFIFIDLRGDDL